ncbi:uncharacterized protein LOC129220789 [Uloborus diversus]|uniref:uncharacterized protein LOC129220789 n=1 Tax=Uloborus diversus TaxID=327109 RepID=UPI0024092AE3|nr:uncharacterized protein LOC129220789 [Uloborus diversus]
MAACSSLEDKSSSSKDPLPLKIFVPDSVNHAVRENCYREFSNVTNNSEAFSEVTDAGDLRRLSIDAFQELLEEASTFERPEEYRESRLLRRLREEAGPPEDEEAAKGLPQAHSLQDLAYPPIVDPRDIPLPDEAPRPEDRRSKFYVDYNDVDTTVTFPLKFVSSMDEPVDEQLKRQMSFPMVPWPNRPFEVRSFFSSMPLETDPTRGDKQLTDVNGNPFSKSRQTAGLASLVSSSLMDYGGGLPSEGGKNRKNKRTRQTADKGVLSESIEGHRGEEDIDALLRFINSSDKKGGKKKGLKHHKGGKKKEAHSRSSSTENLASDASEEAKADTEGGKEDSGEESGAGSPPGRSGFAADFYSTADVSSQTVEESGGFLIVKKKQRKKHQGKRSDAYRWRMAQTQCKKGGIMLPLAESKCGKQDSRRKSTSSVPHSDHSSADNSDLDSVHSLPVRGSAPHPEQPRHPHTTPSSSSSTPGASYADIARMPISRPPFAARQCNGGEGPPRRRSEPPAAPTEMRVRSCSASTRETDTQTEPCPSGDCERTEAACACSARQRRRGGAGDGAAPRPLPDRVLRDRQELVLLRDQSERQEVQPLGNSQLLRERISMYRKRNRCEPDEFQGGVLRRGRIVPVCRGPAP